MGSSLPTGPGNASWEGALRSDDDRRVHWKDGEREFLGEQKDISVDAGPKANPGEPCDSGSQQRTGD